MRSDATEACYTCRLAAPAKKTDVPKKNPRPVRRYRQCSLDGQTYPMSHVCAAHEYPALQLKLV